MGLGIKTKVFRIQNQLLRRSVFSSPRSQSSAEPPNQTTLDFLATTQCRDVAEVGIDYGATSEGIARWLNNRGTLHVFDYQEKVESIAKGLEAKGFKNVIAHGNSHCIHDSYNWNLMKLVRDNPGPIFDYVFLDGAHTWAIDALAFFLLDRLLRPGGYMDFDDYGWTLAGSHTCNPRDWPAVKRLYTLEQIETPQVNLIVDHLVLGGGHYNEIKHGKIYQKR